MRLVSGLLILCTSFSVFSAEWDQSSRQSRAYTCAKGTVTQLSVGKDDKDAGNIIEVQLSTTGGRWWIANNARNLNDSSGYAMLNLLALSKLTGQKVALADDKGTRCDDFNGVTLTNEY